MHNVNHSLGTGAQISFWFDPWCGKGHIVDILGLDLLAVVGSFNAKVSEFIHMGEWNLPISSSHEVNQLWAFIRTLEIPKPGFIDDKWIWKGSALGDLTLKITYNSLVD